MEGFQGLCPWREFRGQSLLVASAAKPRPSSFTGLPWAISERSLSAAHGRGTVRPGWPVRPVDPTIRPGGSLGSCAASPSPACAWRCPVAATIPGGIHRSAAASIPISRPATARTCVAWRASRSRFRRSRRNRATSGRVRRRGAYPARTRRRASKAERSSRYRGRRISATSSLTCHPRRRRAVAQRRRAPTCPARLRCRPRRRPTPRSRRRPPATRQDRSTRLRKVRRSPTGAPVVIRPSPHQAVAQQSLCPMAMAPVPIIHSDGRIETVPTPR